MSRPMLDRTSIALLAVLLALAVFGVGGLVVDLVGAGPEPTPSPTIPDFALAPAVPIEDPSPAPVATTRATSSEADDDEPAIAPPVTIAFAGDVHGEEPIGTLLRQGDNPLESVADLLGQADLAVVNLETAVGVSGIAIPGKPFTFQAAPALLDRLADSGVDIVSMANNHALDFGIEGADETVALAEDAGLAVVGYGADRAHAYAAHVLDIGGRTVAVVGLTRVLPLIEWASSDSRPGMASAYDQHLHVAVAAVRAAAEVADHVVVTIHWGQERHVCPDGNQIAIARALADAGADVVAGHHAHVLQGLVEIDDTLVAYGLGNFSFYARTPATQQTGVLTVTLGQGGVLDHEWAPAVIDGRGRPQPVPTQAPLPTGETLTATSSGPECGPPG